MDVFDPYVSELTFRTWNGIFNIEFSPNSTLNNSPKHRVYFLVAALAVMLTALRLIHATPVIAYASILIASSLLYLVICRDLLISQLDSQGLVPLIILLVIVRFAFLGMRPIGSDDVYRYVWDGKVQAAGINPYRYAPDDTALAHLHTDQLPALVNHSNLKTLYFPLSEWSFYCAYRLSGEHIWGYQLLILFAEVVTIVGLVLLLRHFAWSPWRVLFYAANPLVILQFSLDAHVDALGFPFLVFALLFYFRKKLIPSLFLLGLSLLIKPTALVLLPVMFLDQKGILNRVKIVMIPLGVMLVPFIPYSFGVNPFDALMTFTEHWYFNGALFSILLPIFPDNQTNRMWCLGILMLTLLILYLSRKSFSEKLGFSILFLLLCSPVAHLWYMGWLIVLLPVIPLTSGIVLAATASLPSVTFVAYQLSGVWRDYPTVLLLEYVPVVIFLIYDLRRNVRSGNRGIGDNLIGMGGN